MSVNLRAKGLAIGALCLAALFSVHFAVTPATAASAGAEPPAHPWSFNGWFGSFDRDGLRRGLQVYREVCAGCHGLKYIAFRNLIEMGLSEGEAKAIAAEYEVTDGPDEDGEMFDRAARLSDMFPAPFENEQSARSANNGALPPDLSLITKARANGPDYLHAILVGYEDEPPEHVTLADGMYYNGFFPGGQIAMPPPLFEELVEYEDGTEASIEQMANDVVMFLHWAADPKLEDRKRLGIKSFLFLLVLTALFIASKRLVWARLH
jgi:cytochrome c1